MKGIETIIAILIAIISLVVIPIGMKVEQNGNRLEKQAKEAVEKTLLEIQTDGVLTAEQYTILTTFLTVCGYRKPLEIKAYYEEVGISGQNYQYSISVQEILKELQQNGRYRFSEGMYVYFYVPAQTSHHLIARILYGRQAIERSGKVGI